jgi:hypothetical protein
MLCSSAAHKKILRRTRACECHNGHQDVRNHVAIHLIARQTSLRVYVCVQSTEKTEGAAADGVVPKATAGDASSIKLCTQPQAVSSSSPDMTLRAHGCLQPTHTTTLRQAASVCGPCGRVDHDAANHSQTSKARAWTFTKVESFETDIPPGPAGFRPPSRSTCIVAKTHDAADLCYTIRFDNVRRRVKLYSAYCIRTKQGGGWLGVSGGWDVAQDCTQRGVTTE